MLRSRLGPSGLHPCYGSSFVNPALLVYPSMLLSGRLARPVSISRGCSLRPPGSPRSLSGAGDRGESWEIELHSISEGSVSGDDSGFPVFCGFSVPGSDLQAAVSRRQIFILRSAASLLLAVSSWHSVLSVPSCSRGQASHEVPAVPAAPVLGSPGRLGSGSVDSSLSLPPPLVIRRVSSVSGGLSRPRLLVRRLGRGLGCSPGSRRGFRPLVSRRGMRFHQRSGASGSGEGSPPLPVFSGGVHCGRLCGQLDGGGVPSEVGGYPLSSQRDSSDDPPVIRATPYHSRPTVHPGLPQCPCGLSVSSSPDPGLRVDPSCGRVSGPLPSVAGDGRFVCHLSKSLLFCLFLSLPGSSVCGDGHVSTVVGRSSSLRIPSLVRHSPGPGEASHFSGDLSDTGGSVLASAPVVSRAPGSGGCSSGSAAVPPGSSVPTLVRSTLSGPPQASASCLEALRRFTRAAGFSSDVASQVGLARRTSSRTNYQLMWSTY